jgi:DNA primase
MISMPYITKLGGVVSLKFRQINPDREPKYLTPYPTRMYNTLALDRAEHRGYVALTEGEYDSIILDAFCDIPAVSIPGVETYKHHPEWKELFRGFNRVLMFADPDEAGQRLASQVLRDLDTAQLVALPGDVNETYLSHGADAIRELAGL